MRWDDTLFIKHSRAPVTILAVKDRVLAHNPLGALYTSRHIYTRLKTKRPKKSGRSILNKAAGRQHGIMIRKKRKTKLLTAFTFQILQEISV